MTPSSSFADSCILVNEQEPERTQTAKIVVGATLIALVGGIAYAVFGTSCHKKHHSQSSNSCSYSPFSYDYDHRSHSDYSTRSNYRLDSSSHSSTSVFSRNDVSNWSGSDSRRMTDPQFVERGEGVPIRSRKLPSSKHAKEVKEISGRFIVNQGLVSVGQGKATAFVRHPDGSFESLGNLSLSRGAASSVAFGPYTHEGNYYFGFLVDKGSMTCTQTKIGSVEVYVNGATVAAHDFNIPINLPSTYEPASFEYRSH